MREKKYKVASRDHSDVCRTAAITWELTFQIGQRLISILFFSPLLAYLTIWNCDLISITLSHNTQYKTLLKIIVLCRSWLFFLFPLLLHLNSNPERWLYLDATNKFSFNCFRAHSVERRARGPHRWCSDKMNFEMGNASHQFQLKHLVEWEKEEV